MKYSVLVAALLALSLSACGEKPAAPVEAPVVAAPAAAPVVEAASAPVAEAASAPAAAPAAPAAEPAKK